MESRSNAYLLEDVMQGRFDYGFYQEELWTYVERRHQQARQYRMDDVKHWVYSPCWSVECEGDEHFVSIYQVLQQRAKFPLHIQRIEKADTQFPLIVIEDEFDKHGSILDGNHRFAKLVTHVVTSFSVHFISRKELFTDSLLYRKL